MVISTQELLFKYKDYMQPSMKIKSEVSKGNLILLKRGLYETDKNQKGHLLASYMKSPSYLSFEYALSFYGLIPEMVNVYTSATCNERHTFEYKNQYGTFTYQDVPEDVYRFGITIGEDNGYIYIIATPEKALCDYLYIQKPVKNKKQFISLLFDSLRIDYETMMSLKIDDLLELAKLYKKTNLYFFVSFLEDVKNGRYHHESN